MELCLFSRTGVEQRHSMEPHHEAGSWHLYLAGIGPGQRYGYRVHRPGGNPAKLLLDPYARRVTGQLQGREILHADNPQDSAPAVPRAVVVDPRFAWGEDRPPRIPWSETVLYEAHVRGLTRLHPRVPKAQRGTFLGLAAEPVLHHLRRLGVTAVELMPVQHFVSERTLVARGLTNYWGYNPLAFLAPHAGYGVMDPVVEFKTLVRTLHRQGLEVILDMVLNHTAEGGADGPTLSLKGLDDDAYYRRDPESGKYTDFSGCGNTLDLNRPRALRLALDCLRYWAGEMHVDGFRFDLAPALGRRSAEEGAAFDPAAPFFREIAADPLLRDLKLIAEPWDLGPGGYRLGHFPSPWAEWNDRYRDTVRAFWRGDPGCRAALATRLAGSSDLFFERGARASIHFVTCHDGFTLRDLVSYREKHNHANGEGNRDGHANNLSDNFGIEGPVQDPRIRRRRRRRARTLLATLLLSRGVPMLAHGDELGRTQQGNNNAYCHDGPLTWVDWQTLLHGPVSHQEPQEERREEQHLTFLRHMVALRRLLAPFRRGEAEVRWLGADGRPLKGEDWRDEEARQLMLRICQPEGDVLLLLNGGPQDVLFHLPLPDPRRARGKLWHCLLDSAAERSGKKTWCRRQRVVAAGSLAVLQERERDG